MHARLALALVLLLATLAGCRAAERRDEPLPDPGDVVFLATADTPGPLYLTGPFNAWHPGHADWRFAALGARGPFRLTVPRERLGPTPVELKVTRGSWATVEAGPDFAERPPRRLDEDALAPGSVVTLEVVAFADER